MKRKYSLETKLEVVLYVLEEGHSRYEASKEYAVSKGDIQKWVDAYEYHGASGLTTKPGTYSGDFKVNVVEYMQANGLSARKTAAVFNIPSYTSVCNWERIYNEGGTAALLKERRGLANFMSGTKKGRTPKIQNEAKEDLAAEVKRLRMENEYLKKLNALIQEKERSAKKTK